jgi:hypothetical protein
MLTASYSRDGFTKCKLSNKKKLNPGVHRKTDYYILTKTSGFIVLATGSKVRRFKPG